MRRWLFGAGLLASGFLASCGSGPPPIPTASTAAPVAADIIVSPTTETVAATDEPVAQSTQLAEATAASPPAAAAMVAPVETATAVPVATTEATVAATAPAASVEPLDTAACEQLWGEVAQVLNVDVERSSAPFANDRIGSGTSCRLVATGSGAQFKPFAEVAADLRSLMVARDWTEELGFMADGPTGTATAYRKGDATALVSAGWVPAPGVSCDGPIADCEVAPEQQNFTVSLDLVQLVE